MTYDEWMTHVDKVMTQYLEGAVTAREVFNSVVNAACDVEQLPYDPAMPDGTIETHEGETNRPQAVREYNPEAGERIVP